MKLIHCHQVLFSISAERASIRLREDCLAQVDWNAGKTNKYKIMFYNFLGQITWKISNWHENLGRTLFAVLKILQLRLKFETLMASCSRFPQEHKFQWQDGTVERLELWSNYMQCTYPTHWALSLVTVLNFYPL